VSSKNGDKARMNRQQKRRRVRRAELSILRKAIRNKKLTAFEPGIEGRATCGPS
jgi:hypothetical protein